MLSACSGDFFYTVYSLDEWPNAFHTAKLAKKKKEGDSCRRATPAFNGEKKTLYH